MSEPVRPGEDVLNISQHAEVRITVHLPGACTESGEPEKYEYSQLMAAEDVRIERPSKTLRFTLERAVRVITLSMRFR